MRDERLELVLADFPDEQRRLCEQSVAEAENSIHISFVNSGETSIISSFPKASDTVAALRNLLLNLQKGNG